MAFAVMKLTAAAADRVKAIVDNAGADARGIRVGIKKGDTKLATQINNAIADMIQDGSWQRAISDNTKGTAYTPNAKYNPPEPTEGER